MKQLMEIKEKSDELEIEITIPKQRYKCVDCGKSYTHIQHCKDGKDRCKNCKKKMVTNKFYDPNWRIKQQFVGKFSMSAQEKSIIMTQQIKQGKTYTQAKNRVEYDTRQLQKNRVEYDTRQLQKSRGRKYFAEKAAEAQAEIKKKQETEMNKKFLAGLIKK